MADTIQLDFYPGYARLTLNRPEAHNAMSNQMVAEILAALQALHERRDIRALVIAAAGKTFCSGGDIKDMQEAASQTLEEKVATMSVFDHMLRAAQEAPQVILARVQGSAMGGGFGLVCAADIAVGGESAKFGLPEVRLGLSPALISPYVISRLGISRARQLMLTGARFGAEEALAYGLLHEVAPDENLDEALNRHLGQVLECSPNALAETKKLIAHVTSRSLDESLRYRAELISTIRETPEAQEGMMAFIQKRPPSWTEKPQTPSS